MRALLLALPLAVALGSGPVQADDDEWIPPVTHTLTKEECGDCHMAFQPGFLPARSWNRMMDTLSDHFGDDASIPADKAEAIRAYLTASAGDVDRRGAARDYMRWVAPGGAPQRITGNPAFAREHDFRPSVWQRPDVVTKSNCLACHKGADRGYYEDD
ncbi:cytochrome C [Caenispirillum salinarum]|uniref:cytochrome C n=1 Tax=Caenispirillum salinarum TaxID=859058 RepID=UPI00384CB870